MDGTVCGLKYNGTAYYFYKNLQGDVIGIANYNGVIGTYSYDAWGNIIGTNTAGSAEEQLINANPLRYRGYIYDTETGFYYLQTRYYDPEIGRLINADDVSYLGTTGNVLSYNLFAYCENDAINNSDPTGCSLTLTATGLAVSILAMISIRFLAKYIVKAFFCAIEGIVKIC